MYCYISTGIYMLDVCLINFDLIFGSQSTYPSNFMEINHFLDNLYTDTEMIDET